MIGASKILTVSYGTFSCTLEGFDDPFNTMRAIAEYFRDLAAEDRYFGAEPPTPDAAMLLKIAEREVQRRVEAKIQDNSVILRTGDAMEAPAFVPAPQSQAPVSQSPVVVVAPPAELASAPMPDGVAAKLLRIRAAVTNAELAVARDAAPVAFSPAGPILTDYTEDQHADDFGSTDAFAATFEDPGLEAETVDAQGWDQPDDVLEDLNLTEAEAEAEADLATDVQNATDAMVESTEIEDAPASQTLARPEVDLAALAERLAEPTTILPASDAVNASGPETDIDLAKLVSATADADLDFSTAEDDAFDDEMADADYVISADDLADLQALDEMAVEVTSPDAIAAETDLYEDESDTLLEAAEADASEAQVDDAFADDADMAEQTVEDPVLEEIDNAYAPVDVPARGPSEKILRARARVIKVRREDAAAADIIAVEASAEVAAMLADDKEDRLRRDLRALQVDTDTPNPNDGDDETGTEDDARKRLDAAGEVAVSRLIEQTNEAMAVPENRRRLSAIAHLKAAVAATVADRFTKGGTAPKEVEAARLDPYRDDLARVVRPLHPTGGDDASATPRPAPLVLVSAQRIDRPRTAPGESTTPLSSVPNAPVRPRRVTSAQLAIEPSVDLDEDEDDIDTPNIFNDSRGFAEFSERLGANSLPEILEAAAAYSVCIEGRPFFSRPQLMGQIGALAADSEYTREDGLRTFGMLLREGRIRKIKRGQFVLNEGSHYLAEARKIAG